MVAAGWFKECGTAHLEDVSSCRVSVHLLWVFQRHCVLYLLFFIPVFFRLATVVYPSIEKNLDAARTGVESVERRAILMGMENVTTAENNSRVLPKRITRASPSICDR